MKKGDRYFRASAYTEDDETHPDFGKTSIDITEYQVTSITKRGPTKIPMAVLHPRYKGINLKSDGSLDLRKTSEWMKIKVVSSQVPLWKRLLERGIFKSKVAALRRLCKDDNPYMTDKERAMAKRRLTLELKKEKK